MTLRRKRVTVVGGGPAGMMAVKCVKEEGLKPVCYERTSYFGGTWCIHEDDVQGIASVTWTTVISHSKEMGAPSDFAPNEDYPNYMRHSELLEMIRYMAEKADVVRHVQYNTEVTRVSKAEDYEISGRWIVEIRNNETGDISENTFEAVLVCVGHLTYPEMAKFPGTEKYRGKVMHSHSLRRVDEFQDQKVVVVGVGCSGLYAATEISNVEKQVYLSTRTGTWIMPRIGPNGVPLDFAFVRRYMAYLQDIFGVRVASIYLEKFFLNKRFDHELYNIKPRYHELCRDPVVNDTLPYKGITGYVVLRENVKYFTENGVVFDGEDRMTEANSVILATGYMWKFPFLDEGILITEHDRINLYKCMFPSQLPHPTLALIGFFASLGPRFPVAEMQSRWVCHLLANDGRLPSTEFMTAEDNRSNEEKMKRFGPSERSTILVDFIQYMDDVASQFGVKPNLFKMAYTDPKLFLACMFGPFLPYQHRL